MDDRRDRWLLGLASRLQAEGVAALPTMTAEQVEAVFEYLDSHEAFPSEPEGVLRHHLTPAWLTGGPTLREAHRDMRAGLDAGTRCPCCSKWVKRYRRRLNGSVVRSLAWLVLASDRPGVGGPDGWVDVPKHAPRWMVRGNPHPKLRLWGFAERRPVEEGSSVRSSGMWRPTALGRRFVAGSTDAPESVFEYQSDVDAVSAERVRFDQVLDVAFDYTELMAAGTD